MKGKRLTEQQLIGVLKKVAGGGRTEDLRRKHGIAAATFYGWKARYQFLDQYERNRSISRAL